MKKAINEEVMQEATLTEEEMLQAKIQDWKKEFCAVYKTNIAGYDFIFRPMNRAEYKFFRKEMDSTEEDADRLDIRMNNEENIVKVATLYPQGEELEKILNDCGGIANLLSDDILYYSGFAADEAVFKL